MTDPPGITRFLDEAFRNIDVYPLGVEDVRDIAAALDAYTANQAAHIAQLTSALEWFDDRGQMFLGCIGSPESDKTFNLRRELVAHQAVTRAILEAHRNTKSRITPEWCLNMAKLEEGHEVGAGVPDLAGQPQTN